MTRQEAIAAGATRYTGKRCTRHPELQGARRTKGGHCPSCVTNNKLRWQDTHPEEHRKRRRIRKRLARAADPERYRARSRARRNNPEFRERQRIRKSNPRYLEQRRKRYLTDDGQRKARAAERRSMKAKAIPSDADARAIDRAYAQLKGRAQRLGLTVDHIVPLRPCRVCKRQGEHHPLNWQLLTKTMNSRKGNRCQRCARRDMLSRALPEEL